MHSSPDGIPAPDHASGASGKTNGDATATATRLDRATIEAIAREVRDLIAKDLEEAGLVATQKIEMADRWSGGEVLLRPGKSGVQEKAIPIETFFRKVVLARERMRVLEQKVNNHPKLDDGDKIEMQKYLTQIYGSFTTFNVLFADRLDWFVGQKSDR